MDHWHSPEWAPGWQLANKQNNDAEVIVFVENQILLIDSQQKHPLISSKLISEAELIPLGKWQQQNLYLTELNKEQLSFEEYQLLPLRGLILARPDWAQLLSRAKSLLNWKKNNRFCGRCGNKLVFHNVETKLICNNCNFTQYPSVSPCIIVLIENGDRCVLARKESFPQGMFSAVAGFIDPGESAEDALIREVKEEVNLEVHNIRYFNSQMWPFPSQLMIGYRADYLQGEIIPDGEEIVQAAWFSPDNMPDLPPKNTISRALIDDFLIRNHSQP